MTPRVRRLIDVACILAMVGLLAMLWSVLDPRPIPVFVAMSVGQAIGTLSFLLLGVGLVLGLTKRQRDLGGGT